MKLSKTERGFELVTFMDGYGALCQLQQSSAIDPETPGAFDRPGFSYVWLGKADSGRMHLSREQVIALTARLEQWLASGSLRLEGDPDV